MTPGRKKQPSPVARRRTRERQERRTAILRAAEKVFYKRGFALTTMDQVARQAELSKGTLYLYFKNKDDLQVALSSRILDEFLTRFEAILAAGGPGIEQVLAMLRAYGEVVATNPEHFRTTVVWMVSGHAADVTTPEFTAHRAKVSRVVRAMVEGITRGQRDGSIRRELDPRQTAFQIWAGVLGVLQIQVNRGELTRRVPERVDFQDLYPGFLRLLGDGLRPARIQRRAR